MTMKPFKIIKMRPRRLQELIVLLYLTQYGCEPVEIPILNTLPVENITFNSAACGGRISSEGGDNIISRGLVWDTIANPSFERYCGINNKGSGVRLFFITMTDLIPAKQYFVRAFATNSAGTAYGEEIAFMTRIPVDVVEDNSLVISTQTQAVVDLVRTAALVNGSIFGDKVIWENYLYRYNYPISGQYPYFSANLPSDVELSFSLSSSGSYSMKVKCISYPEGLFSILSFRKYVQSDPSRMLYGWTTLKDPLPADYYKNAFDPLLMTSPLQAIMSYEFGYLRENYGISSGPDNYYELGRRILDTYSLRSGFSKPVFYVFSMIHQNQADYSGYNVLLREIDRYYNSKFSMAPVEKWNLNFTGSRNYTISAEGVEHSMAFSKIVCDEGNSGFCKINGISQVEIANPYSREFYNYLPPASVSVEMYISSQYALAWTALCYIVCAENLSVSNWAEERDGVINPADSWDQNPKPVIIRIDRAGTSEIK